MDNDVFYAFKGSSTYLPIDEESSILELRCTDCDNIKFVPVEATDSYKGVDNLLLPENIVRWLKSGRCSECNDRNTPGPLKFLTLFCDVMAIEIEKEDLKYFNLLFPTRKAKHFRLLISQDEYQVVKNSNLRWKDISE